MYLDWLATAELCHGVTPTIENHFLGVVAIDGLPAESWPGILNSLDRMPDRGFRNHDVQQLSEGVARPVPG